MRVSAPGEGFALSGEVGVAGAAALTSPIGRGRVGASRPGEGFALSGEVAPLTLSLSRTGEGTRARPVKFKAGAGTHLSRSGEVECASAHRVRDQVYPERSHPSPRPSPDREREPAPDPFAPG
ncbi:hypothetical protein GCM10007888_12910 [Methylobacterium oxalidis]|uniref:Uncharacterized protein n=1 Tax=Methylobacterium oxalidis TaxID=944322 RepID=A0ABQ6DDL5_9HYPH|nr:hypothetical protein GCM10007888_12910 [Methylobacterium oxalidis]